MGTTLNTFVLVKTLLHMHVAYTPVDLLLLAQLEKLIKELVEKLHTKYNLPRLNASSFAGPIVL